jgi:AcrR family transcriptional regulator
MNHAGQTFLHRRAEGRAVPVPQWQQRKSEHTQAVILDAAIDCLAAYGYAHATTQLIAHAAGVSRGAMLHHYPTRHALVAALIDHVFHKRLAIFIDRFAVLADDPLARQAAGIELYWQTLLTSEFTAFLELQMAARTDPELREMFLPKAREYSRVERLETLRVFPEWAENPNYDLAVDFVISAAEGLLRNRDIWDDPGRAQAMRQLITRATEPLLEQGQNEGATQPTALDRTGASA